MSGLLRALAEEGRAVLVSSHLLTELSDTADRVVVLDHGRLVADAPLEELLAGAAPTVEVLGPDLDRLSAALIAAGGSARRISAPARGELLLVDGLTAAAVGDTAARAGLAVHRLTERRRRLDDVVLELAGDSPASMSSPAGSR